MTKRLNILKKTGAIFFSLILLFLSSCKTDEFKFGELHLKDNFNTELIAPLFAGNLEFRDFLHWEGSTDHGMNDSLAVLKFTDGTTIDIPFKIIFNPAILIDNFPFSIQGNYELTTITMEFRVNNSTPFPLNLKLRYFDKRTPQNLGPPIQPPAFDAGEANGTEITSVQTIHQVPLDEEQRQSFINGNRIQFKTWFDKTSFISQNDTLNADYPVDISVILLGEVKVKNEDQ